MQWRQNEVINQWENTFWNDTSRDWCVNNVWQWLVMIATWTHSLTYSYPTQNICILYYSRSFLLHSIFSSFAHFSHTCLRRRRMKKWGYNLYNMTHSKGNLHYINNKSFSLKFQVYVRQAWQAYTCSLLIIILMSLGWTFDRDGWIYLLIEYTQRQIVTVSQNYTTYLDLNTYLSNPSFIEVDL